MTKAEQVFAAMANHNHLCTVCNETFGPSEQNMMQAFCGIDCLHVYQDTDIEERYRLMSVWNEQRRILHG